MPVKGALNQIVRSPILDGLGNVFLRGLRVGDLDLACDVLTQSCAVGAFRFLKITGHVDESFLEGLLDVTTNLQLRLEPLVLAFFQLLGRLFELVQLLLGADAPVVSRLDIFIQLLLQLLGLVLSVDVLQLVGDPLHFVGLLDDDVEVTEHQVFLLHEVPHVVVLRGLERLGDDFGSGLGDVLVVVVANHVVEEVRVHRLRSSRLKARVIVVERHSLQTKQCEKKTAACRENPVTRTKSKENSPRRGNAESGTHSGKVGAW